MKALDKKTKAWINTFTPREREVLDYLLKGFTQAVSDLKNLKRDAENHRERETRIVDRFNNYAFTAQVMNIDLNYTIDNDFEVTVGLMNYKLK